MAKKTTYTVKYRRAREGKTNYKNRLKLLLSNTPRLVVRISLKTVRIQLIEYKPAGDNVITTANSNMLAKYGWAGGNNNTPAAYLTGILIAKMAKTKNCIGDIPAAVKGSVAFAAIAGAMDGGLNIPATKTVFPSEDRLTGKHIATYAKMLKTKDEQKYKRQFAQYLKKGFDPEKLPEHVASVKAKILGEKNA